MTTDRSPHDIGLTVDPLNAAHPVPRNRPFANRHVALVVAHPDDEVLGTGGQFDTMRRLSVIHVTDGAFSRGEARAHGFETRRAYAEARQRELDAALASVVPPVDRFALGLRDQQAAFSLVQAAVRIAGILAATAPDLVLTHSYEGGHSDHDSTAFATAAAMRLWGARKPLWEFASYHRGPGYNVYADFLPRADTSPVRIQLTEAECATKRRMLDCFVSQKAVIDLFPFGAELFRPAFAYDFTAPPHAGRLMYETRTRAWHGAHWRHLAKRAGQTLAREGASAPRSSAIGALYGQVRGALWSTWVSV